MTRARYVAIGAALMAVKYAGDFLLVLAATGHTWTPKDYVYSLFFALSPKIATAPTWLLWAMGVWVLPFVIIGVRLTMRRAIDAGWTPWVALGFFVPIINYVLMIALSLAPTAIQSEARAGVAPAAAAGVRRSVALAIAAASGALLGPLMIGLCVYLLRSYSSALFLGTPYVIGVVSGYVMMRLNPDAQARDPLLAGLLAIGVIAALVLLSSLEGAVCLLMAVPIAIPLVLFGASTGRFIAQRGRSHAGPIVLGLIALPMSALMEPAPAAPMAREVFSAIEIAAAPDVVWPHVVAFEPMAEPTDWMSRSGIAYPKSAHIVGTGVGAIRYCEFSTGAFVEPITAWEPGHRLAFDVTFSPPPMRELSFYSNVHPPHLDGFLRSRHGEFRLVALPGGRTRLEGRTWYELDMAPEWYWRLYGDWTIHRIHARVLEHIKQEVGGGAVPAAQTPASTPAQSAIAKRIAEAEAEGAKHPRVRTPDPYPRTCNVIKPEQIVFPTGKATDPYIWSGDFDAVSISFGWDKTYEQAKIPLRVLYPNAIGNGLRIRLERLDPPGSAPPFTLNSFNAGMMNSREQFFASWPVFPTPGKWMMIMTAGSNWGCFVLDRPVKTQ
jgi:hypothetical protein